jgi:hypothetical protein
VLQLPHDPGMPPDDVAHAGLAWPR